MFKGGVVVLYNHIPSLIAEVEAVSRGAPKRVADSIVSSAKARAPVRTGALRESIQAVSVERGKTAEVTVGVPYAAYVEYGTYKMGARPFLTPAFEEHSFELVEAISKTVGAVPTGKVETTKF